MEEIATLDKQGRLYLPKKFRKHLSAHTLAISTKDEGLVITPVEDDPIEALAKIGRKHLKGKSIKKLRKQAREELDETTSLR